MVFACFLITCIAIGIYYNLKIPALRFEAIANHYEAVKTTVKKAKETAKTTKAPSSRAERDEESSQITVSSPTQEKTQEGSEKSLLKSILKDKLANKIQQKEDEQTIRQLHINFPKNKPTFSIDLLDKNTNP